MEGAGKKTSSRGKGKGGTEGVAEEGRDRKKGGGKVGVKRYGRREGAVVKGSGWGGGKG